MTAKVTILGAACSDLLLSLMALYHSYKLFKNHRAPSVGFFVLGAATSFSLFHPFTPSFTYPRNDVQWAGKLLTPTLVSFDYLWISHDYTIARIILCGCCVLLVFSDWLFDETLIFLTRCMGLSCLSCCMTISLFAGNALGAVGGAAICVPLLMAEKAGFTSFPLLDIPEATDELLRWLLDWVMLVGCWLSARGLNNFLSDMSEPSNI